MSDIATRYYEFVLDGDRRVIVESAEPFASGGAPVAAGRVVERAKQSFQELVSRIPEIIEPIYTQVAQSIPKTEEVKVEFGFKVSGDLGIIIAKTQAEANFKITFTWKGAKA
jgi:hypothetical protein